MSTKSTALTCYAVAKMTNARLEAEGIKNDAGKQKQIPPQMIYNYTLGKIREGKKPMIAIQADGLIAEADALAWINKYIANVKAKIEANKN